MSSFWNKFKQLNLKLKGYCLKIVFKYHRLHKPTPTLRNLKAYLAKPMFHTRLRINIKTNCLQRVRIVISQLPMSTKLTYSWSSSFRSKPSSTKSSVNGQTFSACARITPISLPANKNSWLSLWHLYNPKTKLRQSISFQ